MKPNMSNSLNAGIDFITGNNFVKTRGVLIQHLILLHACEKLAAQVKRNYALKRLTRMPILKIIDYPLDMSVDRSIMRDDVGNFYRTPKLLSYR